MSSKEFEKSRIGSFIGQMKRDPALSLAVLFGIVMPIASAAIYPTYRHRMPDQWVETTRILELQFVAAQALVIFWALRRGMSFTGFWSQLPRDSKLATVLLLVGVLTSSILYAERPIYSRSIAIITVIHLAFVPSVWFLIKERLNGSHERYLPVHGVGLALLAVLTAWWFLSPPPLSEVPEGVIEWGNAVPGWIHVRHFGSWTGAIAAGFAIKLLYDDPQRLDANHVFYALAAAMTVWSGTRGAILAMIVVLAIVIVSLRRMPKMRAIVRAFGLTLAAVLAAWAVLPNHDAFWLFYPGDTDSIDALMSKRDLLWLQTYEAWLQSPWLGWGSGATQWKVDIGWAHTQPHNAILQFLISWGLVGAVGGLWLILRAIVAVHPANLQSGWPLALLAMLYALLFQSLLEGTLFYPRFIVAIIVLFALLARLAEQSSPQEKPEDRLPAN